MADRTDLRREARLHLVPYLREAILLAMNTSEHPELVLRGAPATLVGFAGSLVLQGVRTGQLNDGESDKVLAELQQQLREHADPSLNPVQDGMEIDRHHGRRTNG